ncbi:MAG: TonB-dependent receptor, partial [Deltaproteobacteria bacterium]
YLYGGRGRYTHFWTLGAFPTESRLQVETRNDQIHVALYRQVQRRRFFTVNRLAVDERSTSGFLEQQVFFTDWMQADVGLRGDVYFLHGFDDLPVQPFDPNLDPVRIRGRTTDGMVSPKANLILTPAANTDVFFNFGTGFHSNDARNALLAESNPRASGSLRSPLTRAIGYEIGSRTRQLDDRLDLAAALWWIDLDSELVFSGDVGNQETAAGGSFRPARASRRYGVDVESLLRVTHRLTADYDLSYADPRFRNGDAIPLAPTLLMNGGLTLDLGHGFSTALRVRFLDDRPAIEDRSLIARGYTLLDLIARWRWRKVEASLALLNLTDTDWREAQFADASCVRHEVVPGRFPPKGDPRRRSIPCVAQPGKQTDHPVEPAPDIHFTPGNPFGVRAGITVFF